MVGLRCGAPKVQRSVRTGTAPRSLCEDLNLGHEPHDAGGRVFQRPKSAGCVSRADKLNGEMKEEVTQQHQALVGGGELGQALGELVGTQGRGP